MKRISRYPSLNQSTYKCVFFGNRFVLDMIILFIVEKTYTFYINKFLCLSRDSNKAMKFFLASVQQKSGSPSKLQTYETRGLY